MQSVNACSLVTLLFYSTGSMAKIDRMDEVFYSKYMACK